MCPNDAHTDALLAKTMPGGLLDIFDIFAKVLKSIISFQSILRRVVSWVLIDIFY